MDKSYIAPLGSNGGGSRHRLSQVRKRTRGMNLASLVLAPAEPKDPAVGGVHGDNPSVFLRTETVDMDLVKEPCTS